MVHHIKNVPKTILLFALILSCSGKLDTKESGHDEKINDNCDQIEKIELHDLPKSKLVQSETIHLWDSMLFNPKLFEERTLECRDDKILTTDVNYAYDTVINKFAMRLIIHRTVLGKPQSATLLKDVNFFINELNATSCWLQDKIDPSKIENIGDMIFYDEVIFDPMDCNQIICKYKYKWFAGGGSSIKGERHYKFTMDDFRKWSSLPMSSDDIFEMGEVIFER